WIAPVGPHIDAFEIEVAERLAAGNAVALSSGTAALHLALLLASVGPGDVVLVPTMTFAATANAVTYVGAEPVFVDVDVATWQIDPRLVAEEVDGCAAGGRRVAAIVAVDLYGQCYEHDRVAAVADDYGIPVIEDAAEAMGATYRGKAAGTLGDLGVLSFNGNKIMTTSGGGMLLTDDADMAGLARHLATQARDDAPHYQHSRVGYNYRMSNLLAAVGRGQLRTLDRKIARRRDLNAMYRRGLEHHEGIEFMPFAAYGEPNAWLTCITVDPASFGATRDDIRLRLLDHGIESRPLWKPLHLQPVFGPCRIRGGSVAEVLFERGLCLPSGSSLTDQELEEIVGLIVTTPAHRVSSAERGSGVAATHSRPA
ncbi:MAG: aminotransferase class I/II-fold pyridoxal phosphate-dependent enzyme, partial [Nitriliruptorales bacterium]|nr:aminotransferase class I/II-fold pyridoxal phosphate-dependent enzyme [Nitriliruptorales bacterium]